MKLKFKAVKKIIVILLFCQLPAAYGEGESGLITPEKKPTPVKYVYQGHKNRNPFYRSGSESVSVSQETQGGKQSISDFCLTGIMTDISGTKYAILTDEVAGSYILKNGWLYDAEGKRVPSITGTVFEERVIIIIGTRIKELKLPEEGEATVKME
ncbi:MAG: hypothetical protein ABIH68_00570 [bacterium]